MIKQFLLIQVKKYMLNMNKIFLIVALLASSVVIAQPPTPPGMTKINARYDWLAGKFGSFTTPAGGATPTTFGNPLLKGNQFWDSVNHIFYIYNGSAWQNMAGAGGTPGGSNQQVQFNNSGAFGASSSFIWNGASVGIGTSTPSSKAILDLTSTIKGFLAPRMTTTQQNAITSPATGLMIFNTDSASHMQYTGTVWQNIHGGGGGGASFANRTYVSQTNGNIYSTVPKVATASDTLHSFGDSFSTEYGVGAGQGYNTVFAARFNLKIDNQALSGSGVWQAAKNANGIIAPKTNNDVIQVLAGFNDLRRNGSALATLKKITSCLSSIAANNLIDSCFPANSARVTTSGSWSTNDFLSFGGKAGFGTIGGLGIFNNTSASYVEWTATGQNFIVGFLNNVTTSFDGGEFDVSVDGTLYTHVVADQTDGISDGVYDNKIGPGIVFVKGLTNAAHTIRVTNTLNKYVYVDYFATVKLPKNTSSVIFGLVPKMDATGYATSPSLGSDAVFERGDTAIINAVNTFYGWPVTFVPVNDYYILASGLSSADHIHPNVVGHRQLADAFSNHVSPIGIDGLQRVTDIGNTTTNNITANSVTIGISPTTVNPYIFFNRAASATNEKIWDTYVGSNFMDNRVDNDAYSAAASWMKVYRSGFSVDHVSFLGPMSVGVDASPPTLLYLKATSGAAMRLDDNSGNNSAFIANYLDFNLLAVNRNPATGVISNSGKTAVQIALEGAAGSGNIRFYTTNTNNSAPGEKMTLLGSGNFGIGQTSPTALLHIAAGGSGASAAPLKLTSGTNLATPEAGAMEYDGTQLYYTSEAAPGRGAVPLEQYFHLTSNGSAITTIANFFGATSNPTLVSGGYYEIEAWLFFATTGTGTVTFTFTNSVAPTSQNIVWETSPEPGGIVAPPGTATMLSGQILADGTAARTIVTNSLNAANHYAHVKFFIQNSTGTSFKIQATAGGTNLTPQIGSWWRCRRLATGNVGIFVN